MYFIMKSWVNWAKGLLDKSLTPVSQELNELDWKQDISGKGKRLSEHLSAFANYPGGGILAYGIGKTGKAIGVKQTNVSVIIEKLSNTARDGVNPVLQIEHTVISFKGATILLLFIKESSEKSVHLKGKSIESSYIRSGGTTRQASRQEIGNMMLNSKILRYEELHASKLLKATEVLDLLDYQSIYGLLERPVPQNSDEVLRWMEKEKMVEKITGSGYYITNFGALAAAKDFKDFEDLERKTIRLVKYKGLNKSETEREQEE